MVEFIDLREDAKVGAFAFFRKNPSSALSARDDVIFDSNASYEFTLNASRDDPASAVRVIWVYCDLKERDFPCV